MNIITGIISAWGAEHEAKGNWRMENAERKTERQNSVNHHIFTLSFIFLILSLAQFSCTSKQTAQEDEVSVKTDVKISSPTVGTATILVSYQAVTRYMQSNDIRSQVTGIVTRVNCSVAGNIAANQPLFTVQPQEAAALKKSKFNDQILTGFSDTVYAHISGQISQLNVQVGDFVQSGDILATCIRANSMRIVAYIPVERIGIIEKTRDCSIILPDGTKIKGKVSGKLASAETQDQTQAYLIEPEKSISLAENINLTVQFMAGQMQDALFVKESAVLGNEEQTSFWVMKLINDSTCIQVQVEKGIKQDSLIQVINSGLTNSDFVITEGGYGLADSARVQVINRKNESQDKILPATNKKTTGSRH